MPAMRRLPVSINVWQDLKAMKGSGQTYDDLLGNMIEQIRKAQLEDDLKIWENSSDLEYVPLSKIED